MKTLNTPNYIQAINSRLLLVIVLGLISVCGTAYIAFKDAKSYQATDAIAASQITRETFVEGEVTTNAPEIANAIFTPETVKVGDKVGRFVVESVGPFRPDADLSEEFLNLQVVLSGNVTVTGSFEPSEDLVGDYTLRYFKPTCPETSFLIPFSTDKAYDYCRILSVANLEAIPEGIFAGVPVVVTVTRYSQIFYPAGLSMGNTITIANVARYRR